MNASLENLTGAVDRLLHTLQYDGHTIAAYHRFWNRICLNSWNRKGFLNSAGNAGNGIFTRLTALH